MRVEVRLDRADVAPVAVEAVAVDAHRRIVDHRRHDVAAEVVRGVVLRIGEELVDQHLAVEDVDAHRDQVGLRVVGLLIPLGDAVVVVGREDAVAVRLFHRHLVQRHGDIGLVREVLQDQLFVVHLVDVVAGEDEHELGLRLFEEVDVLEDGVGGAAVPVGAFAAEVRLQQRDAAAGAVEIPRPADADVVVEGARPVLRHDADARDVGVDAVAEREVDDAVAAAEDHGRLRALFAQHAEPVALTAGQDQRYHPLHRRSLI